jgi:hypothetical protein
MVFHTSFPTSNEILYEMPIIVDPNQLILTCQLLD